MRQIPNISDSARRFHLIKWFWWVVIGALFVLSVMETLTQEPGSLHGWNGWLTAVLLVADVIWFAYMMLLRRSGSLRPAGQLTPRWAYALACVGLALTIALILLHGEFLSLLFANIGIIVFALDGWTSLLLVAVAGGVFVYEVALRHTVGVAEGAGDVLSVVSVVALVYSMRAVMNQRTERDRLIAELRRTNEQLGDAHQELRLAHARDIELAALRERNRLARDMHDSLGHALVLIAIKIEAAQRLQSVDPERAAAEWEETKALVRATMADLRHSLAGLRLPALEDQPFHSALAELGSEVERTADVTVTVDVPEEADLLDRPVQEALYRVVQEALANVAKHARAKHADVRLELQDHTVRIEVVDDGIGLAASHRAERGHYGVTGMRERVEVLGGRLSLGPRDGDGELASGMHKAVTNKGTMVRATIPIKEQIDASYPHLVG